MKPITVQKVSAILRKAGFTKSNNDTWHPSEGYRVYARRSAGTVIVHHAGENATTRSTLDALEKYRAALEAEGVEVSQTTDTPGTRHNEYLICTGIKEE